MAFSPDGKRIVSGGGLHVYKPKPGELKVWDAATGRETLSLKGHAGSHTGAVFSVAFSPDGKRIVSGGGDETVKVWDASTGKETLSLKGHTDSIFSVAFSPDGKRIVSGSWDKTVKVWDVAPPQSEQSQP
jgi:WD40 repeat protein